MTSYTAVVTWFFSWRGSTTSLAKARSSIERAANDHAIIFGHGNASEVSGTPRENKGFRAFSKIIDFGPQWSMPVVGTCLIPYKR